MTETVDDPLQGVTPYLTVRSAKKAVRFYKQAFGAEEVRRVDAEDRERLMHGHLKINGADILLADVFPEHEGALERAPFGVTLHLAVDHADEWWHRAISGGAEPLMPLADQFWGDRYGQVRDPFGHTWSIGAPIRKSTEPDPGRRACYASVEDQRTATRQPGSPSRTTGGR